MSGVLIAGMSLVPHCGNEASSSLRPINFVQCSPHRRPVSLDAMLRNIPLHMQQQFTLVIHELQDAVGREDTQVYWKFPSHIVESNDSASIVNSHRNIHDLDTQCKCLLCKYITKWEWLHPIIAPNPHRFPPKAIHFPLPYIINLSIVILISLIFPDPVSALISLPSP